LSGLGVEDEFDEMEDNDNGFDNEDTHNQNY